MGREETIQSKDEHGMHRAERLIYSGFVVDTHLHHDTKIKEERGKNER